MPRLPVGAEVSYPEFAPAELPSQDVLVGDSGAGDEVLEDPDGSWGFGVGVRPSLPGFSGLWRRRFLVVLLTIVGRGGGGGGGSCSGRLVFWAYAGVAVAHGLVFGGLKVVV